MTDLTDLKPDAHYACMAMIAEDMYVPGGTQEPPWDPRLTKCWNPLLYVTGIDALLRKETRLTLGDQRVFYGFLAESRTLAGTFALVIRGTMDLIEWLEDAEFCTRAHPAGGHVEDGFYGIAQTLLAREPGGKDQPLAAAAASRIANGRCIIIGHSLGGAVSIYSAFDLSRELLNGRASLRTYGSPHPGDSTFNTLVATQIPEHLCYANARDVVPKVPFWLGYSSLPNLVDPSFGAAVRIRDQILCNHHALCYASLIDPKAIELATDVDRQYLDCILS